MSFRVHILGPRDMKVLVSDLVRALIGMIVKPLISREGQDRYHFSIG